MSVTAKFLADFSDFHQAVQKAEVELRGLESGAGKVGTALNRMADSFSGRKVIQDANLAARAVESIGGATKLTQAEQTRLNVLLTEALAKYKALGQQAPAEMQALAKQTQQAASGMSGMASMAGSLASALGVTFSIGAVVGFGRELLRTGDELVRVSDRTGLAIDAVQRLDYIAKQSGNSLDELTGAIGMMQKQMDDPDFQGAIEKLGINFEQFRKSDAYHQLALISTGLRDIKDPADQAQEAIALFGRSGAAILPSLKAEFDKLGEAAPRMSEGAARALDDLGDAMGRAWGYIKSNAADTIGVLVQAFERAPQAARNVNSALKNIGLDTQQAARDFKDLSQWVSVLAGQLERLPRVTLSKEVRELFSGGTVPKVRLSPDEVAGIEADLNRIKDAKDRDSRATSAQAQAIRDLAAAYSGAKDIQAARDAIAAVNLNLKAGHTITEMSRDKQDELNKVIKAGIDAMERMGQTAPAAWRAVFDATTDPLQAMKDTVEAMRESAEGAKLAGDAIAAVAKEIGGFEAAADEAFRSVVKSITDVAKAIDDLQFEDLRGGYEVFQTVGGAIAGVAGKVDQLAEHEQKAKDYTQELAQALSQLAQVSGGAFGGIVRDIGTMVESLNVANKSIDSIKVGWSKGFSLSGIAGMASGILGLASAAISAGKAIGNLFDRNKGRDLVNTFAGEHGGYDSLHNELLKLGDDGERLWISLTQGVGRNNPEQARRAIAEVETALNNLANAAKPLTFGEQASAAGFQTIADLQEQAAEAVKLYEYMRDSGLYSAETVQAAWERANEALIASGDQTAIAARRANDEVKKLTDQIQSLTDSIANEAPEEVMGVIEQQTRAQIASLEAQRDAAQQAIEDTAGSAADSAAEAAQTIKDTLAAMDFVAKLRFEYELPEGLTVTAGFAGGTRGQYLDFGAGTPVMLHGRERVMTEGESGGAVTITVPVSIDGREIARANARYMRDEHELLGVR